MGIHADLIAATAARCCKLGVAGVDLNCGCPSKTVVGSGAGGAKLRDPQWLNECLTKMRAACPGRGVSVKIRSGFADPAETAEIVPAVVQAGVDFAIMHFRTVQESYGKVADGYQRIARAKNLAGDTPILASGDLFTVADAAKAWEVSGCDGVAPARGLLSNPFIIADIMHTCRTGERLVRGPQEVLKVLEMEARINRIPGVVTVGIFADRPADILLIGGDDGVREMRT